jgi:calmodulin
MGLFSSKPKTEQEDEQVYSSQSNIIKEENKIYKDIDQLFHEHDKDNDLCLDKEEFTIAITEYSKRSKNDPELRERLEYFIEQMLIPKNKKFSKDEFRIIMSSVCFEDLTMNEVVDLFKTFDKRKDGKINENEIVHTFKNLGLNITTDIARELIKEASYGDEEHIDFEEFIRIILSR